MDEIPPPLELKNKWEFNDAMWAMITAMIILKLMFSKKATKIDEIFTFDLTLTT